MRISGLIIAAGLSGRMNSFKPILKIKDQTLVQIISEKLLHICDNVLIVTGYNAELVEAVFEKPDKIKFVYNENFTKGMFTSLKKGIENLVNSDWVVYHFVDQPTLPEIFYKEFVQRINSDYNWIQPSYKGKKGHPILIAKDIFAKIIESSDESSLKEVSKNPEVRKLIWDCDYQEVLEDIDTSEDFNKIVMQGRNLQ